MAFQIKLLINDKEKTFIRNGEPTLRDITNGLKVEHQQVSMYSKSTGPDNADFDANESNLADFAVSFWKNQFTKDDVIDGATLKLGSLDSINNAITVTLEPETGEDKDKKKSRRKTSPKQLTTLTPSTKGNLKKGTS